MDHLIVAERRDRRAYWPPKWGLAWDRPGETWDGVVRHMNAPGILESNPEWSLESGGR